MKKTKKWFLLFLLCPLMNSCLLGPNYHPPENCIPCEWALDAEENSLTPVEWWKLFCDPLLNKYIETAAIYNNDVQSAEASILQATALRQVTASDLYPHINANFNALRIEFSKTGPFTNVQQGPTRFPRFLSLFNAFLSASWQIDLFGKVRRSVEAADAVIQETIEQRNEILTSIFAEITQDYIQLRSAQKQMLLIEENIALLERNEILVGAQVQSGYRNGLDLEKIEAELANAYANLPGTYAQIFRSIFALSTLTGNIPETLICELMEIEPLPCLPCDIGRGLRSDLLRRRPDIRYAESKLAEATANIGVAIASFFPSINLFGAVGFDSIHFRNLFQARNKAWLIDGNISMPLFQGGKLVGNLIASQGAMAAAAFSYQQTILKALEEAESAYISYSEELKAKERLEEVVFRNERIMQLTNARYEKGLVNVIDLLDSERGLISSKLNLLSSETAALMDLVALYKALGGGWEFAGE